MRIGCPCLRPGEFELRGAGLSARVIRTLGSTTSILAVRKLSLSQRINFSDNAPVYDQRHGGALPDDGLRQLCEMAGIRPADRLLDIAAGTGRVAIPLAMRGCRVVAIEPAPGMLEQLRRKDRDGRVGMVMAEGAHLPFSDGTFGAVVIARLLYLTTDWRGILHEARRLLVPGGCLLHEWGNGRADEEWVQIREEARRRFEEAGLATPFHPGVRSEDEVDEQLGALGLARQGRLEIGAGPTTTLRDFLGRLTRGELSYIWGVPEEVRRECLPGLQQWAEQQFNLDEPVPMPRTISWTIFRKGVS